MLIAAIGSVACGALTWIIDVVPSCDTATDAVLAASAPLANTNIASAAAATGRAFIMCCCPFLSYELASLRSGRPRTDGVQPRNALGSRKGLPDHVPVALAVLHEIRLADREVVRRRRRDPQAIEQERVRDAQARRSFE